MFIYALDNTITADLVPAIVNEFGSVTMLPWLSVGFTVGGYVALLPVGKLYAKYNAKWVYIISVVIFLASSALCAAAPNMNAMIIGRVFLGVSGSSMYCGILTLMSVLPNEHQRPAYLSLIGLIWGAGTVLGPVVGGAFAEVDWRWAFYINLIIGGVFLPVYIFVLPPYHPISKTISRRQRMENYDYVGTVLFIGLVLCLVMAINFGGVLYAWDSGSTIALFVVGFVLLIVFIVQQWFAWFTTEADRIFPAKLIRIREADLLFASSAACNTAIFIPIFYIPVYFQFSRGDSALEAAVRLLPLIMLLSAAMLSQGFFIGKTGYYWPWYTVGAACALAGNVLLYTVDIDTPTANIYGYEILVGFGTGIFNQAGYAVIHTVVSAADVGYAIPFMMTAQFTGITIALSISGAVFINGALNDLARLLPNLPSSQLNEIISGTSSSAMDAVPQELRPAVIETIVDNLALVYIPAFVGAALALLLSAFLSVSFSFPFFSFLGHLLT